MCSGWGVLHLMPHGRWSPSSCRSIQTSSLRTSCFAGMQELLWTLSWVARISAACAIHLQRLPFLLSLYLFSYSAGSLVSWYLVIISKHYISHRDIGVCKQDQYLRAQSLYGGGTGLILHIFYTMFYTFPRLSFVAHYLVSAHKAKMTNKKELRHQFRLLIFSYLRYYQHHTCMFILNVWQKI